jgi:hypothetical protein
MPRLNEGLRPALRTLGRNPPATVHAGLLIDRLLCEQTFAKGREPEGYRKADAQAAKAGLVARVAQMDLPVGYRGAYEAWKSGFAEDDARVLSSDRADALGRVIIGIGQKGPAEFGITLHHTWGTPILPGSSLKGIASLGADAQAAPATAEEEAELRAHCEAHGIAPPPSFTAVTSMRTLYSFDAGAWKSGD